VGVVVRHGVNENGDMVDIGGVSVGVENKEEEGREGVVGTALDGKPNGVAAAELFVGL
jgi:hypothetical protein